MTIKNFTNNSNKPDNRKFEYEQDILRLGRERASVEQDLDRKKRENNEAEIKRNIVLGQIKEGEKNLALVRQELVDTIKKVSEEISATKSKKKAVEDSASEKENALKKLQEHLADLLSKIEKATTELNSLNEKLEGLYVLLIKGKDELTATIEKKQKIQDEIDVLCGIKESFKADTPEREKVLLYIEEKDKFLNRKERDLEIYEKRVKKAREEVGITTPMIFK